MEQTSCIWCVSSSSGEVLPRTVFYPVSCRRRYTSFSVCICVTPVYAKIVSRVYDIYKYLNPEHPLRNLHRPLQDPSVQNPNSCHIRITPLAVLTLPRPPPSPPTARGMNAPPPPPGNVNRAGGMPRSLPHGPKQKPRPPTATTTPSNTRSGGISGSDLASEDPEAMALLIRGVGTHLDVATRATRLRGMRVGEAVAALGGQELRFDELDGERQENQAATREGEGDCFIAGKAGGAGGKSRGAAAAVAVAEGGGDRAEGASSKRAGGMNRKKKRRQREGVHGAGKGGGGGIGDAERTTGGVRRPPGGGIGAWRGGDDDELDPDTLFPLGGGESESDSDDAGGVAGPGRGSTVKVKPEGRGEYLHGVLAPQYLWLVVKMENNIPTF